MRAWLRLSPATRLGVAVLVGAVVGAVAWLVGDVPLGLLTGIAMMELVFVVAGCVALWPMNAEDTRGNANREDFRPVAEELAVVGVASCGLVAIVLLLVLGHSGARNLAAAIALGGVFLSWAALHLMYATRYAHIYYTESGGIDFHTDDPPSYQDFLYFSYNLGMTYQVSDNNLSNTRIRAVVLRHCVLSYVFGTGILATTINLVVGSVTGS